MSFQFEAYNGVTFDLKSVKASDAVNEADFISKVWGLQGGFVYEDTDRGLILVEMI